MIDLIKETGEFIGGNFHGPPKRSVGKIGIIPIPIGIGIS
jgi:hypothetical protein